MTHRKLCVYLLLDTSGSMKGEPIEALNAGLDVLVTSLRQNPFALECVYLCVLSFDLAVREVVPLTALEELSLPHLATPSSGPTHLGAAIEKVRGLAKLHSLPLETSAKSDWAPLLFVMTDGKASDQQLFRSTIKKLSGDGFGKIVGFAAGPAADTSDLLAFCDEVYSLSNMDIHGFSKMFEWVSRAVGGTSSVSSSRALLTDSPKVIAL